MRFRYFNIALPALLALAACSDDDGLTSGNGQGEVRITTHISGAQTRAPQLSDDGSGNFGQGDTLNLAVYGDGATPYTTTYYANTNSTLYWEDIIKATGQSSAYTFVGWYNGNEPAKLLTDASFDVAAAKDKDLLLATPTEVNEGDPVNMIFRHAMHKLVVNLSYGEGFDNMDKSAITVKPVGMNAAATIDVKAGTVTVGEASATKGDYDAKTLSNNSCSFILAPQKLQAGAEWLQIQVTEGQTISFHVPEQIVDGNTDTAVSLTQLNSGETLTLNLTIKRTNINDIAIELTGCTISDWTPGANYEENVAFPEGAIIINLATLTEECVINDDETYNFSGSGSYGIKVTGGTPEIYLENAQISVSSGHAIDIQGGNPTIHVRGKDNQVTVSKGEGAGIYVAENHTVTITGNSTEDAISVTGSEGGAGIGGQWDTTGELRCSCGNINISNVTITAKGSMSGYGDCASGIGAAGGGTVGSISISNAIVYAEGGGTAKYGQEWDYCGAAAIGGGSDGHNGGGQTEFDITISNSTIHATKSCSYATYIGRQGEKYDPANYDIISSARITNSTIYKYAYGPSEGDPPSSDGSVVYDANGNRTDQ